MRKARPERMRFTFRDEPAGAIPLALTSQRHWIAGLIFAIFFAVFAAVAAGMIAKLSLHRVRDVTDLMFMLFDVFWLIGWSVGVLLLGGLTLLFLFYRESARLQDGKLVHVPRLGPLKVVCEYDLAKISNLRLEEAKDETVRVRFDYGNGRAGIGDAMPREAAEAAMARIKAAIPMSARAGAPLDHSHPSRPPDGSLRDPSGGERHGGKPRFPSVTSFPSMLALVAANLLPLAGVLLLGWDLAHVMVLYWAESAIIGVYTVLKLCVVAKLLAVFAVPFFIGHFGGFMAGHFIFVYLVFVRGMQSGPPDLGALDGLIEVFQPLWPALLALAVSHGISFAVNFIGRREYSGETIQTLMLAPYRRIIVMHLTIIFGGGLVMLLETPAPALALLVLLKTAVDLRSHRREHAATAKLSPQRAAPATRSP